jgi:hypothetical protein
VNPAVNVAAVGCLLLAGGVSVSLAAPRAEEFPLTRSGPDIKVRASTKPLTGHSVSVTVELLASAALPAVKVILRPRAAALSVTPADCRLQAVNPPAVAPAAGPPYPLPAIPLCTFVVSTTAAGRYRVTITVENSAGHRLLPPLTGILSFEGTDP